MRRLQQGADVPPQQTILDSLTTIANEWRVVAIVWHGLLAASLLALLLGWRPTSRLLGGLIVLPIASVSVISWTSANPFNAVAFGILTALLLAIVTRFRSRPVEFASPLALSAGAALILFGWTYPHFLKANSWTEYAYAAPFGLLPCPTLAVAVGATLMFALFRLRAWSALLGAAGFLYGTVGVFRLGVTLDVLLLAGVAALTLALWYERELWRSVRADSGERNRRLAGDEFIAGALDSLTHAVTIRGDPREVWPWLAQMGAGVRAGWYSYDFLDNGRRASAERIIPELQQISIGTVFPALPDVADGFTVLAFQPVRSLVLGWRQPDGEVMVTWAFVLERTGSNTTRLIVRARAAAGYQFHGLPPWLSKHVMRAVHYVMQRKQLLGIAHRVESPDNEASYGAAKSKVV